VGFWDTLRRWLSGEPGPEPAAAGAAQAPPVRAATPAQRPPGTARAEHETPKNPYAHSAILDFDQAQVRQRFFELRGGRISPLRHPDAIPAPDDEFTALVDRAMVLGGYLTPDDLGQIHEVGDLWRKHSQRLEHARVQGLRSGQAAVDAFRAEREALKQTRRAQAAERTAARARERERRHAEEIDYLGRGVSGRLHDKRSQPEKLEQFGLPYLAEPKDVAQALGVSVSRLRWLCFHEVAPTVSHYHQFQVPKRSGGLRTLAAPMPELAAAQRWIFDAILQKLEVTPAAHGFVRGRSTVSNATPHVGQALVLNLDLEEFFPTITFPRVRGIFQGLGYSPAVSTVLALLCTECPRRSVSYDGVRYQAAVGPRALPQGACTSPALANRATRRLDRRLAGLCQKMGFSYTRYADDLTFSAAELAARKYPKLLGAVRRLIDDEGFRVNPKKGRIQRRGGRQDVTGIVVNDKPGLPRGEVRRLRAILHGAKRTGLAAQNRENHPNFRAHLEGKLAYLAMVDRAKGLAMLEELRRLPEA
jgi:retron-type reverse transcriptase